MLGKAATGSGKTLAFGLPLLARIGAEVKQGRRAPRGLVLVPTRELAQQVHDNLAPLGQAIGVQLATVYGGAPDVPPDPAAAPRRRRHHRHPRPPAGPDQPGRGHPRRGRRHGPRRGRLHGRPGLPAGRQGAARPDRPQRPAAAVLGHAGRRGRLPGPPLPQGPGPARGRPPRRRRPRRPSTWPSASPSATSCRWPPSWPAVPAARSSSPAPSSAWTGWPRTCKAAGIKAEAIHGGLPQAARKRALEEFTDARSPVLVATDVAARGIHVDDVSLVLHYDPPTDAKTYLHRSGRTARAGAAGVVVSLLLPDQVGQAKRRFRTAKVDPPVDRIRPGDRRSPTSSPRASRVEPKERTQRDMRRGPRWPRWASAPRRRPSHRRLPWRPAPLVRRQAASGRRAVPRASVVRRASSSGERVLRRPAVPRCAVGGPAARRATPAEH